MTLSLQSPGGHCRGAGNPGKKGESLMRACPSTQERKAGIMGLVVTAQLLICVQLFTTPWTAACQASLSFTISLGLLRLMSIESVMPSSHLILCRPLLLLPSVFPSIRVFSNESVLHIRWPKYWSFSFSMSPSKEYSGCWFPLGWTEIQRSL